MSAARSRSLAEAFVGSLTVLLLGFVTVPLAGLIVGVHISSTQGAKMGAVFFFGRVAVLYAVRRLFVRLSQ